MFVVVPDDEPLSHDERFWLWTTLSACLPYLLSASLLCLDEDGEVWVVVAKDDAVS